MHLRFRKKTTGNTHQKAMTQQLKAAAALEPNVEE
jgi:hypothetical protein